MFFPKSETRREEEEGRRKTKRRRKGGKEGWFKILCFHWSIFLRIPHDWPVLPELGFAFIINNR